MILYDIQWLHSHVGRYGIIYKIWVPIPQETSVDYSGFV